MTKVRALIIAGSVALAFGAFASCSAGGSDDDGGYYNPPGAGGASSDAAGEQSNIDVPVYDPDASDADPPGELCKSGCDLDIASACSDVDPPPSGAGGAGGEGGEGGAAGEGPGPAQPIYGCRAVRTASGAKASCSLAGTGRAAAPCLSSEDCAPGFACVGEKPAGFCRPFCCGGNAACGAEEFCDEQPLVEPEADGKPPLRVPVCMVPDNCDISQPPCTDYGNTCACSEGEVCAVVKGGQTSCVRPGTGTAGEACPCAWGYVCSQGTNRCLKLCVLSAQDADAGDCGCMASSGLPKQYGVCSTYPASQE